MVNADKLEYSEIINSLLNGDFYTSTGPQIYEISVDGMTVNVKCSDALKINLTTKGRRAMTVNAENGINVNEATFNLMDTDGYFRISVLDEKGRRADSQSFWLEDFIK
jgi:hypothetical protein